MPLICTPDSGIPLPESAPVDNLDAFAERVAAASATADLLETEGLEIPTTLADAQAAAAAIESFAAVDSSRITTQKLTAFTPATARLVRSILDEFSVQVVEKASDIRNLVTNKLLIESENPDAKIRMKALELLGKISDVGLFTERSEVTITHQSSSELQDKLRDKLRRLMEPVEDAVIVGGEEINVPEELGLAEPASELPTDADSDDALRV